MAIKTVSLAEDAYELLTREKKPNESFSDVVRRLAAQRRPLSAFAGAWKNMPPSTKREIEVALRRARQIADEKSRRRLKRKGGR